MAFGTRWNPGRADECVANAERQAGASELGYLYRFDRASYAYCIDPEGDHWGFNRVVELTAYRIHKLTPCGWTLDLWSGARRRFVSRETNKRFALPTIEEAIESFVKRQERRIAIMEARAAESREALRWVRPGQGLLAA